MGRLKLLHTGAQWGQGLLALADLGGSRLELGVEPGDPRLELLLDLHEPDDFAPRAVPLLLRNGQQFLQFIRLANDALHLGGVGLLLREGLGELALEIGHPRGNLLDLGPGVRLRLGQRRQARQSIGVLAFELCDAGRGRVGLGPGVRFGFGQRLHTRERLRLVALELCDAGRGRVDLGPRVRLRLGQRFQTRERFRVLALELGDAGAHPVDLRAGVGLGPGYGFQSRERVGVLAFEFVRSVGSLPEHREAVADIGEEPVRTDGVAEEFVLADAGGLQLRFEDLRALREFADRPAAASGSICPSSDARASRASSSATRIASCCALTSDVGEPGPARSATARGMSTGPARGVPRSAFSSSSTSSSRRSELLGMLAVPSSFVVVVF